uniref:ATP synthase complex subunit 8 n=1 Tax=Ischalia sp. BMNH 840493 TaxID=904169 RepID=E3VTJ9_9CUCU|nr:ATP synthase F0 subunit 8 [Ischalia sp. BMNH 840493]
MPQMYPLLWLYLMMIFVLSFLMVMILNYFSLNIKPLTSKYTQKFNLINWKW